MKKYAINGNNLFSENAAGLVRFGNNMILAMDDLCVNKNIELVMSKNRIKNLPDLKNIKLVPYKNQDGFLWQQFWFPFYLLKNKAIAVNLCNVTQILKPNGIIVIHDIDYAIYPNEFKSLKGRLLRYYHLISYFLAIKFAKKIFCVSDHVKKTIVKYYKIESCKVDVIYNGYEHIKTESIDDSLVKNFSLNPKEYIFSYSSYAQNKNFNFILNVAKNNPNSKFVICGKITNNDLRYIKDNYINVQHLGYVQDECLFSLLKNSKTLLFPSFHEGFGIPPLEALALGTKVICSKIDVFVEIYGDSVYYVDPYDYNINLEFLLSTSVSSANIVLNKCSWKKSAKKLVEYL
jgi:glycosyltransferase involved in cell wall biosynthesis